MLSLPSRPWKRIRLEPRRSEQFLLTIVSPLANEAAFERMITQELGPCLGARDTLTGAHWETKSVVLTTRDIQAFKRKLVYACVLIEKD